MSENMNLIEELRERKSFLTSKEVMELLRCRRDTLCAWVRTGRIPAVRSGNGYLYDPRLLADWFSERATAKISKRRAA